MKTLKPFGNDIQMSTEHENRFTGAVKAKKDKEEG